MAVFTIGTAVMLIILSFLNGLEGLVKDLNNSFDPELKISAKYDKHFDPEAYGQALTNMKAIRAISLTLEDNVVVRYGDAQEIARVKGVDQSFKLLSNIDTLMVAGSFNTLGDNQSHAVFGGSIASSLNINTDNTMKAAALFVPMKGVEYNQLNPEASLNSSYVKPIGVIMLTDDIDRDLVIVSLGTAQKLLQVEKKVSSIELALKAGYDLDEVQRELKSLLGDQFEVKNRDEQNESAYRVFRAEKWATFAILTLVLMIAAFNTIGALTMLVLEKRKDIRILESMGAGRSTIRRIFLTEGFLITVLGILLGLILGWVFVWLQQNFGLIRLEGSFVEYFPIAWNPLDMLYISAIILTLGLLASLYPAYQSVNANKIT